jgi:regulation of enolase protein 1 (concanavalin A-like superfamily)
MMSSNKEEYIVDARFTGADAALPPNCSWQHSPASATLEPRGFVVRPLADSDAWTYTWYGFVHDNAPLYGVDVEGDFVLEAFVRTEPGSKYDQAGVAVWGPDGLWAKASTEWISAESPAKVRTPSVA